VDKPEPDRPDKPEPLASALPSVGARLVAFLAIVISGVCGGLIGFALVDLQCEGSCTNSKGFGALAGALFGALGVAVVAVLALRAMGEWKTIQERDQDDPKRIRRKPSA
jgi:hypothetical protein